MLRARLGGGHLPGCGDSRRRAADLERGALPERRGRPREEAGARPEGQRQQERQRPLQTAQGGGHVASGRTRSFSRTVLLPPVMIQSSVVSGPSTAAVVSLRSSSVTSSRSALCSTPSTDSVSRTART